MTDTTTARPTLRDRSLGRFPLAAIATLVLVALADFLLFGHVPGINLFIYAIAVAVGILVAGSRRPPGPLLAYASAFSVAAALPLIEAPSLLACCLPVSASPYWHSRGHGWFRPS